MVHLPMEGAVLLYIPYFPHGLASIHKALALSAASVFQPIHHGGFGRYMLARTVVDRFHYPGRREGAPERMFAHNLVHRQHGAVVVHIDQEFFVENGY